MKQTPNSITFNFFKLSGRTSLKLSVLMIIGLLISFSDLIYSSYPWLAWLLALVSAVMVVVFFTSKVMVTKDAVFFRSIIKNVTMKTADIESSGFLRQPLGAFQRQLFTEVSSSEKIGLFATRLFYISTEEDFVPGEIFNITPSLIYFECSLKESEALMRFLDTRPTPERSVLKNQTENITESENSSTAPSASSSDDKLQNETMPESGKKDNMVSFVTQARIKSAIDKQHWDMLDMLLENDSSSINDKSVYTDTWGTWWGFLLECVLRNYKEGVEILLKYGANSTVGSWGDCIPQSPEDAAKDNSEFLALLQGNVSPNYSRKTNPKLPELTAEEKALIQQAKIKEDTGLVFDIKKN